MAGHAVPLIPCLLIHLSDNERMENSTSTTAAAEMAAATASHKTVSSCVPGLLANGGRERVRANESEREREGRDVGPEVSRDDLLD